MTDWAMSGRRDSYRVVAVDPFTLTETRELDVEAGACTITWGYYTENLVSAEITLIGDTYVENGRDRLIRIEHTVFIPDGTEAYEVLGTFFVDHADRSERDGVVRQRLTCYSTMWRLSKDFLAGDYVRHKGETIEGGIRRLIEYPGGSLILGAGVDASRAHTQDVRFRIGENRLETINTICGWAGWQLGVADTGEQTLDVYVRPGRRSPRYTFEAGRNCTYKPELDETHTEDICNRVIALWSRESLPADTSDPTYGYGLSGRYVATLDPAMENSFERCGRYMTAVLDISEPCSQTALELAAEDYLYSHSASYTYLQITHVGIPYLRPGHTVIFYESRYNGVLCEITQMEVSGLGPLMMTSTKLKVVG